MMSITSLPFIRKLDQLWEKKHSCNFKFRESHGIHREKEKKKAYIAEYGGLL